MFERFEKQGKGYDGYSMSNNARMAYWNDERPLSRWSKDDLLDACRKLAKRRDFALDFDNLKKVNLFTLKKLLIYAGYHHTSKCFNETAFYRVDFERLQELAENGYVSEQPPKRAKQPKQDFDEGYVHGFYIKRVFHPYSRWSRYEEKQVFFVNSKTKGNWLYLPDGSRKALKNVTIEKRTKLKRRKK